MDEKPLKLKEIAAKIAAHLKEWEADPVINARDPKYGVRKYYCANSWAAGSKIGLRYISYQGQRFISKNEALEYLDWIEKREHRLLWKI